MLKGSLAKTKRPAALSLAAATALALLAPSAAAPAAETASVNNDRTIAYVMTHVYWAMYQTPGAKAECPNGFNDGPREQFKLLYPDNGTKRKFADTQLEREREIWFPTLEPEPYPFREAQGTTAIGINLDGKIDANDYTSPDGEKGVDNQLWRAIGCIANYRGPDGTLYHFTNQYMQAHSYNRFVIELTGVDSLSDDDDVTVTTYRGLDPLITGATGEDYLPGGSQRIDLKWGQEFIQTFKGKIKDGVLTTDTAALSMPATAAFQDTTVQKIRDAQFRLKITPDGASGLIAGFVDIQAFYTQLNEAWSTHLQSYGQQSAPSLYRAMRRLADGHPDPATGENASISGALDVKFTQVFILRPPSDKKVASRPDAARGAATQSE